MSYFVWIPALQIFLTFKSELSDRRRRTPSDTVPTAEVTEPKGGNCQRSELSGEGALLANIQPLPVLIT